MKPDDIRMCLSDVSWTGKQLADQLGASKAAVYQWLHGGCRMPEAAATWLESRASAARDNPPPDIEYRSGNPVRRSYAQGN
jgi:hypothetical protein